MLSRVIAKNIRDVFLRHSVYAAETWTLINADRKGLEVFEVWIWKRMLKISWKDKVTEASVLETVDKETRMLNTVW